MTVEEENKLVEETMKEMMKRLRAMGINPAEYWTRLAQCCELNISQPGRTVGALYQNGGIRFVDFKGDLGTDISEELLGIEVEIVPADGSPSKYEEDFRLHVPFFFGIRDMSIRHPDGVFGFAYDDGTGRMKCVGIELKSDQPSLRLVKTDV